MNNFLARSLNPKCTQWGKQFDESFKDSHTNLQYTKSQDPLDKYMKQTKRSPLTGLAKPGVK